ncbi:hypothetical protein BGZ46_002302 [Entomortierella lignicola]|nr:hypothetical protein BGZ46_002302 [Entomortierella lignicola]
MLHVVHVQGGATTSGIPAGSQAANLSSGGIVAGTNGGLGTAGPGGMPISGGMASSSMVGNSGLNVNTSQSKAGFGILPSGGPAGSVAAGSSIGAGGSGSAQTLDAYNSTAWCLIDDGAVGAPPSAAASTTSGTPLSSTGVEGATNPKKKAVLVEVEKDIEMLIAKLKNLWVHRQHAQVEIEYLPQTSNATASNAILEEFVRLISPPGVTLYSPQMLDYPYEQVGLDPKNWSMLHSGFQYMVLFRRQHIL